jgi:hypothetical protein
VVTTLINELSFICPWWYISCNHKIDNVYIIGVGSGDPIEHVVLQWVIDG